MVGIGIIGAMVLTVVVVTAGKGGRGGMIGALMVEAKGSPVEIAGDIEAVTGAIGTTGVMMVGPTDETIDPPTRFDPRLAKGS